MLKKIELLANVSIVVIALLLGTVLVKRYLSVPDSPAAAAAPASPAAKIQSGTKLPLPGMDWGRSEQNLVLVLSDTCRFCTESAEFYQRLAQERGKSGGARLIAVLPQDVGRGQTYLNNLRVAVDEVRQSTLGALSVRGTPTLIMVNREGVVKESWVGKLKPEQEAEVLSRLHSIAHAGR